MKTVRMDGVALITALAILVVVAGMAALMFTRTLGEIRHSGDDTGIVQSLLLARGAANVGAAALAGPAKDALSNIVESTADVVNQWAYGFGSGLRPEPASVVTALTPAINRLQTELDTMLCSGTADPDLVLAEGEGLRIRIYVTSSACGENLPTGAVLPAPGFVDGGPRDGTGVENLQPQIYAIPFVMLAEGEVGPYRRNLVTAGEYRFTVGRSSFAQYALFTNVHTTRGGGGVWFTDNTLFDGPVHTNQHLRFYSDPWFNGPVTSAGCWNPGETGCTGQTRAGAYFFPNDSWWNLRTGLSSSPSESNWYGTHAPQLEGGVDWGATFVPLPPDSTMQQDAAGASGLTFTTDLVSLRLMATDATMNPLPTTGTVPEATYQMIEACDEARFGGRNRHRCRQYRYGPDGALEARTLVYNIGNGNLLASDSTDWTSLDYRFNGVIHTTEGIDRLTGPIRSESSNPATAAPALASFAQITVAAEDTVRITGDLKYERPPCTGTPTRSGATITPAVCDDLDAANILGVYSQNGDVRIGNRNGNDTNYRLGTRDAPYDVTIHGVLMSSRGIVGVDNHDGGAERGSVNLIGGIIEYYYGAFGMFDNRTGEMDHGYSRSFTFDRRTAAGRGMAPPYFPTVGIEGVRSVVVVSFGQREQVE